jgi:hypothetical protein
MGSKAFCVRQISVLHTSLTPLRCLVDIDPGKSSKDRGTLIPSSQFRPIRLGLCTLHMGSRRGGYVAPVTLFSQAEFDTVGNSLNSTPRVALSRGTRAGSTISTPTDITGEEQDSPGFLVIEQAVNTFCEGGLSSGNVSRVSQL